MPTVAQQTKNDRLANCRAQGEISIDWAICRRASESFMLKVSTSAELALINTVFAQDTQEAGGGYQQAAGTPEPPVDLMRSV